MDAPMPLIAATANSAGTPATTTPAALPANDMWLTRLERSTEGSAQWLQALHTCHLGETSARAAGAGRRAR
eukprot:8554121-Pyramimonas_sp.AAC.1